MCLSIHVKRAAAVPFPSSFFMAFKPLSVKGNVAYAKERCRAVVMFLCFIC